MSLLLLILVILVGVVIYQIVNVFIFYNTSEFGTHRGYTINYSQGSGRLRVDFILSHDKEDDFYGDILLRATSTGDVEEIGVTYFTCDVFVDELYRFTRTGIIIDPLTTYQSTFYVLGIGKGTLTTCEGRVDVSFNVNNIIQNETINFEIAIIMPVDLAQRFFEHNLTGVGIEVALIIALVAIFALISMTIKRLRYEVVYPEKEKKRDEKFWKYIREKAEEQKQA